MAIPLEDYDQIFSRPGRQRGDGDEGWKLSEEDELILDRVWARVAKEKGVDLPNHPTEPKK